MTMNKIITDTHAAIDRLVAHLERQAIEHVHALDALRAEVESLRTQNAHLRALQAATEAKPVREVVRGRWNRYQQIVPPEYADQANEHAPSCRCAVYDGAWHAYEPDHDRQCAGNLTESEAIAWVLDGVLPTR